MRTCFLGDSHLASVKMALERTYSGNPPPGDFFGASALRMDGLKLSGDQLVPSNDDLRTRMTQVSGGIETVQLRAYDRFVLVGLGFEPRSLLKFGRKFSTDAQSKWCKGTTRVSEAFFEQFLTDLYGETIWVRLVRNIRSVADAQIHIVAAPAPAETIQKSEDWAWSRDRLDTPYFATLLARFDETFAKLGEAERVQVVLQPRSTYASPCFTRPEFNASGVGFNPRARAGYGDDEFWHMNADYGATILPELGLRAPQKRSA